MNIDHNIEILNAKCTATNTYVLIGVLTKQLTISQLVKKFFTFNGSRKFITEFARTRHLFLS